MGYFDEMQGQQGYTAADTNGFAAALQQLMLSQQPQQDASFPMPMQQQEAIPGLPQKIVNWVSGTEAPTGGMAQDMLSARFQEPSFHDAAQSIMSAGGDKLTTPQQSLMERLKGQSEVAKNEAMTASGGLGGGTGVLVQKLMAENPGMSFGDALFQVQTGFRKNVKLDANGKMIPMTGAPEAMGAIKAGEASGTATGTAEGEAGAKLADAEAYYPQLEVTTNQLKELAKTATYSRAGRLANTLAREAGIPVPDEAVAREKYINIVRDVLYPQLRQTFGAQFTAAEGLRLESTLGDPNKDSSEKQAAIEAFIQQKKATIESMRRRVGGNTQPPPATPTINAPTGAAKKIHFNDLPE